MSSLVLLDEQVFKSHPTSLDVGFFETNAFSTRYSVYHTHDTKIFNGM